MGGQGRSSHGSHGPLGAGGREWRNGGPWGLIIKSGFGLQADTADPIQWRNPGTAVHRCTDRLKQNARVQTGECSVKYLRYIVLGTRNQSIQTPKASLLTEILLLTNYSDVYPQGGTSHMGTCVSTLMPHLSKLQSQFSFRVPQRPDA